MKRSSLCGLAILLAGLNAAAGMQSSCKQVVKNYMMEYCSGFRDKRSVTVDEMEPSGDLESAIKESRLKKRQAMTLSEIIMTSRVPVYNYHYPHIPGYIEYVPVVPVIDDYEVKPKYEGLPQEKNGDLGFEMDIELEELFEELYDRLPRSPDQSENEIYRNFKESAGACCMDRKMCKSMGSMLTQFCP